MTPFATFASHSFSDIQLYFGKQNEIKMDFLDRIILDNRVEDLLWFAGIALGVLIFSSLIAKLISHIFYRLFRRLSKESHGKQFVALMRKPLRLMLVLFVFYLSFDILRFPEELNFKIYDTTFQSILFTLYFLMMAIAGTWVLLKVVEFIILLMAEKAELTESKADDQMVLFVKDILKVAIIILSVFFVVGVVFKLNITGLLAGAGIAGLAIALAAKDSLENLFGSFTIFAEKPFTVGDIIQVGEVVGEVEKVGFRSTRVRTLEKTFVTLPNRKIMESHSENLTLRTFRRVKVFIGVTYGTSQKQIQLIVKDIQDFIDAHELTNQDGIVGFYEFGDSSLNILVQYYVQNMEWNIYIKTREEINFRIMEIVESHGSEFAFPTRTLHLFKEN